MFEELRWIQTPTHPGNLPFFYPCIHHPSLHHPSFIHPSTYDHRHPSSLHVVMAFLRGWESSWGEPWPYSCALCEDGMSPPGDTAGNEHHTGDTVLSLNIYLTPLSWMIIASILPGCQMGKVISVGRKVLCVY